MSKSKRLNVLANLAKHRERQAAAAMVERRRKFDTESAKLRSLTAFLSDYKKRFDTRAESGIQPREALECRAFLRRFSELIQQQTDKCREMEADLGELQGNWKSAYQHTCKMGRLMDAAKQDESRSREKREQREVDDRVPRPFKGD